MSAARLIHMANQIAEAFKVLPEAEAIAATEDHIRKFWDPRMRQRLYTNAMADGEALSAIARSAVMRICGNAQGRD